MILILSSELKTRLCGTRQKAMLGFARTTAGLEVGQVDGIYQRRGNFGYYHGIIRHWSTWSRWSKRHRQPRTQVKAAFGASIPHQESELPDPNSDGVKQSVRYDLGNQPLGCEHATISHSWGLGCASCPCARADGRSLGHNRRGRETMPSSDRQGVSSPPNWKSCVRQRQGNGARPACLFQQMRCERRKSR
jgi:hypothetical protein